MTTCSAALEQHALKGIRRDQEYLYFLSKYRELNRAIENNLNSISEDDLQEAMYCRQLINQMLFRYSQAMGDCFRNGDWIPTISGRRFWLLDPRPEDIEIEDIAHGLSRIPRYNGATYGTPYSVAQHSYLTSFLVPDWMALPTLLHDAHEAYIGDQTTPWKRAISSNLNEVESKISEAIALRFGYEVSDETKNIIKRADNIMLATEVRDLLPFGVTTYEPSEPPLPNRIEPWSEGMAFCMFVERLQELTGETLVDDQ